MDWNNRICRFGNTIGYLESSDDNFITPFNYSINESKFKQLFNQMTKNLQNF